MTNWEKMLDLAPPIRVWVKLPSGKYIRFIVCGRDTIADLDHDLVYRVSKVVQMDRTFVFKHRELDPSETFSHVGISDNDVIALIPRGEWAANYRLSVVIVTLHERLRYGIKPDETTEQFLERLGREESVIPTGLSLAGKPLLEKQSFSASGVTQGSVLVAVYDHEFQIGIKILRADGDLSELKYVKLIHVVGQRNTRIKDIKASIETKESIPVDQQRLMYAGQELKDDKFLRDYDIQKGNILALIEKSGSNI